MKKTKIFDTTKASDCLPFVVANEKRKKIPVDKIQLNSSVRNGFCQLRAIFLNSAIKSAHN